MKRTTIGLISSTALLTACASTAPAPTTAPMAAAPVVAAPVVEDEVPEVDEQAEQQWQAFLSARGEYLDSLAAPLMACAEQSEEKTEAVFQQCTPQDWPSMVQSAYALQQLSGLTSDPRYAKLAGDSLDADVIAAITKSLDHGGVGESPYAYTWLLAVASTIEAPSPELTALGQRVATELEHWLTELPGYDMLRGVMIGAPDSVAWVAQNLWQYGDATGDAALAERMRAYTGKQLATEDYDEWCSLTVDEAPESYELFPPCLHRVLAVLTVMPEETTGKWLDGFLPDTVSIEPLSQASWSTHAALNFSRSWGLWALYNATGNVAWRDLYVDHVTTQMDPAHWNAIDEADRPWIAHFGVMAIGLSYGAASMPADAFAGGTAAAPQ